ncbi:MAG: hypothetical protein ACP5G7_04835 [Anaerolineae bacterium]
MTESNKDALKKTPSEQERTDQEDSISPAPQRDGDQEWQSGDFSGLPPDTPPEIRHSFQMFAAMVRDMGRKASILDKIEPEHIPLIVESTDRALKFETVSSLVKLVIGGGLGFGVLIFLVVRLADSNPELLHMLITTILGALGGFGGGYGIGYHKGKD